MYAEIITIGDEILIGQIVDSNSAWIAQQLNDIGIEIKQISSISDKFEDIKDALSLASKRADIILLTGGLGPTNDDVTREALASYFDSGRHLDPDVLANIEKIFATANQALLDINIKQAEVLDISEVLFNKVGTAPGMYIHVQGKHFFVMPGVPSEMKYLMDNEVIPRLEKLPSREVLIHKSVLTAGIGESSLALQIADIEKSLPSYMHLAYLPSFNEVRLRLSAKGKSRTELIAKVDQFMDLIKNEVPDNWFAEDNVTLEEALLDYLIHHKLRLSTAESCTGGQIAHLLTSIPGSSQAFDGGVVAYSNSMKVSFLGVPEETIREFGAVSEPTVIAMAEGMKKRLNTDYAIATTGIAGPGGGTKEKPVGTVWVGVAGKTKTISHCFHFDNVRMKTIERTSKSAFILLFKLLYEENGRHSEY